MPKPMHRLDLDQLRVTSFPTLPAAEDAPAGPADRAAVTGWSRCSFCLCD